MEVQLADQDYLAGSYSYADIALYMAQLFGERKTALLTAATPGLLRWRHTMTQRKAVWEGVAPLINHLRTSGRPVPEFLW